MLQMVCLVVCKGLSHAPQPGLEKKHGVTSRPKQSRDYEVLQRTSGSYWVYNRICDGITYRLSSPFVLNAFTLGALQVLKFHMPDGDGDGASLSRISQFPTGWNRRISLTRCARWFPQVPFYLFPTTIVSEHTRINRVSWCVLRMPVVS